MSSGAKKVELTTQGKIILSVVALLIIAIIIYFIIPKGKNVTGISIEMVSPNEGIVVYDPIYGMSTELKVGKKVKLSSTIYPEKHKNVSTEYIVENPEIAYVNDEGMLIGKSSGTTKVYMETKNGKKIKSNTIEITVVN